MSITLDEYRAQHPRKPAGRPVDRTNVQAITQDAVRASALTGDENWDWFSRYLEAGIKAAKRDLEAREHALRDPLLVNDDLIRQQRAMIAVIHSRVETLVEILALPRLLVEHADKARKLVEEMERDTA